LGTAAIENIEFLKMACNKFSNKIVLAIDVRSGYIALSGWKKQTKILATDFLKKIQNINVSRIIYTDINKDGTMSGPNLNETIKFSKLTKTPIVISGGISSIDDIMYIKRNKFSNIEGIIVGKAIYDGNIDIKKLRELI
jgi:Phosphoribosylformimino-5-aminoimidazole carboxamide ribonucleotide (ProFAR) isomerase